MSFKKNETFPFKLEKGVYRESPADTPRQSKDSEGPQIFAKKLSIADDLSSGIFSQKMQSPSDTKGGLLPLPTFLAGVHSTSGLSQKIKTDNILNFNNFHRPKPEGLETFEAQEKVILHNLMVFKQRRDAGLLSPRKKKVKKLRKASRVVSEGTKIKAEEEENKAERLIEPDVFPSDRVSQKNQIMGFLKQNKATHSLRSSMHYLTPTHKNNKIDEEPGENLDFIIKGLSPSQFKFDTPDKQFIKNFKKPPRMTKPSWQRRAKQEMLRDDESFLSNQGGGGDPLKWYSRMLVDKPLLGGADTQTSDLPGNAFTGNWGRLDHAFPRLRENDSETFTATTASKIPIDQSRSRLSRLDRLLSSYRHSQVLEHIQEDQANEGPRPGVLNPNVITFEKNPFEDIFEKPQRTPSESQKSLNSKSEEIQSRKSRASSNENIF